MKKLFILFFVLLLVLSMCACSTSKTELDMDPASSGSDTLTNNSSRITEEVALEIASQYWGVKTGDKDEETGFTFFIIPAESLNDNIAIALKWLVDNHHYSTVDSIEIDPYTGKIANRE